ncbi:hypothetical protein [Embleya sp. MST-111070]|uniref:hypothetical protein n=1 Tax=Embleya sp. MST-111070 TaxID=3398231 RepID=UPI003F732750
MTGTTTPTLAPDALPDTAAGPEAALGKRHFRDRIRSGHRSSTISPWPFRC